jgi:hypothetical protein
MLRVGLRLIVPRLRYREGTDLIEEAAEVRSEAERFEPTHVGRERCLRPQWLPNNACRDFNTPRLEQARHMVIYSGRQEINTRRPGSMPFMLYPSGVSVSNSRMPF